MSTWPPSGSGNIAFGDLLQYLESSGRMGVARLDTSAGPARVWFRDGQLIDAESADASGEAAITLLVTAEIRAYTIEYKPIARFPIINDRALALLGKEPRRSVEWQRLVSSMPPLDSVLAVNDARFAREENSLAGLDIELLSLLDGHRTMVEVVADSGLDAVHAMQRLAWYFRTGLVRLVRSSHPPTYPPPSDPPEREQDATVVSANVKQPSTSAAPRSIFPSRMIPLERRTLTDDALRLTRRRSIPTQVGIGIPSRDESESSSSSFIAPPAPAPRSPPTVKMFAMPLPVPEGGHDGGAKGAPYPAPLARGTGSSDASEPAEEEPYEALLRTADAFPSLQGAIRGERVLLGRYEVLSRIARGGMGAVYLCRATGEGGFRRLFALKVLRSHLVRDESATQRFLQEARIAARIYDPHVVGVIDVSSQGGQPFIVMDYVEGGSLQELLRRHPRHRPPRLVVPILLDALSGLHAVHTLKDEDGTPLGLVHCDVSPHNLLVGVDGTCRLSDFGVARWRAKASAGGRDVRHGKPAYVSPEQMSGAPLDARTDLFSMGVILWSALTGQPLFEASTHEATLANVRSKPIPPPSQVGLRPPPCFDRICFKALSRNPEHRYPSAREMLMELRAVALAEGHLAPPTEVAEWVKATFAAELQMQRLGVLDGSRRARAPGAITRSLSDVERPSEPPTLARPASAPPPPVTTDTVPTLALPLRRPKRTVLIAAATLSALAIVATLAWPSRIARLFQLDVATDTQVGVSRPPSPNPQGKSATNPAGLPRTEPFTPTSNGPAAARATNGLPQANRFREE